MIASVIGWLVLKGVPERFAKPLLALMAFLALAGLLWAVIATHDRHVIKANDAKVEQRAAKANNQAASERAAETITIAKSEQETHDVVAAQQDQPIAPTSHALSCERLRKLGRTPPACR